MVAWFRAVAAGLVLPGMATILGLAIPHAGGASAAAIYILAVAGGAALGRLAGGIIAAGGGFLGLNYFFTPPTHTFKVRSVDDGVALAVFLVVALVVTALLERAARERLRAERREREARSLHRVASVFLSPMPLERVVADLAATLADVLSLQRCRIEATVAGKPIMVEHPRTATEPDRGVEPRTKPRLELPIATPSASFGRLIADVDTDRWPLSGDDLTLARAVAAQIAAAFQRAELDVEVERARVQAEASAARAALFSSVTHDLRTPLASIKAGVTSLIDGGSRLDEQARSELLRTTLEETDRLNRLVGNLLDLARVRAGALVPQRVPVDLEDLVGSVTNRLRTRLAGREIRTALRPDLPPVPMDPSQMDQVLTNILENAMRFSPEGSPIHISASVWETWLEVRIGDAGPGIPAVERRRVFDEFYRADRATGRGGTGLGLAIARAIVGAHGGTIWAEGSPVGGAVIAFRLPLNPPTNPPSATAEITGGPLEARDDAEAASAASALGAAGP